MRVVEETLEGGWKWDKVMDLLGRGGIVFGRIGNHWKH
jgi:hypothetical protein